MRCEVCKIDPFNGVALYRMNSFGGKGIWRCWNCMTPEQRVGQDPDIVTITKIIEADNAGKGDV